MRSAAAGIAARPSLRHSGPMTREDPIGWLHGSLVRRETPETVADVIEAAWPADGSPGLRRGLRAAIRASIRRRFGWSSMPTTFRAPDAMDRQIDRARDLALLFLGDAVPGADDPDELDAFIAGFAALIGKTVGRSSFRDDRLDRAARGAIGLSRRRYAKLFRLAGRLEQRLARLRRDQARHRLVFVGKAALASEIARSHLGDHLPTAAFVAYYAARMKLRSEFTIAGQQRPFDTIAASLLEACVNDGGTRWDAIARVFPRRDVLDRLDDTTKGELLGRWFDILSEIAARLELAHADTAIDLDMMIVRRGNDSSSWNIFAGAWNRARDHWVALVEALGLDPLFDEMLPGKVMRLMAGDVAAWHRSTGGGVHPDTLVWRDLPKPWRVLQGEAVCTRAMIEAACRAHGVDPAKSGWTVARPRTAVAAFRPTPELVHGVAVGNPHAAALLRRMGAFSGKPPRMPAGD